MLRQDCADLDVPHVLVMGEINQHKRVFLDFIDQQGYMDELHGMIGKQDKRLVVNLNHLRTFDPELTSSFMRRPDEYLPPFEDALRDVLSQHDPTVMKTEPAHGFRIGVEGNFGSHHVSPRELGAHLLNALVCVEGIVTKCSQVRPKVVKSEHYCPATDRFASREYRDNTSLDGPATGATYPTKDPDGNPLQIEFGMSEYMDHQMLALQEMPERAPPGQLPRSIEVLLEGNLVDQCKPGDRVALSGIHRALPGKASASGMFMTVVRCHAEVNHHEPRSPPTCLAALLSMWRRTKPGSLARHRAREQARRWSARRAQVLGNHVRHFSKELQQGCFHEQDIANIKRLGKRLDCIQLMSRSLAPSIFGHEFEKTALLLMLLGGCERNLANGERAELCSQPPAHVH